MPLDHARTRPITHHNPSLLTTLPSPHTPSGSARAHLRAWVAAADVIARATRAWLFRRAVGRLLAEVGRQRAAVVVLQAAWRGRVERVALAERRRAAVRIQVQAVLVVAKLAVWHVVWLDFVVGVLVAVGLDFTAPQSWRRNAVPH